MRRKEGRKETSKQGSRGGSKDAEEGRKGIREQRLVETM